MEPERHEVYERIPWEHLDRHGGDRQWLYVGLAGAVALGALAYSFMRNQPIEPAPTAQVVLTTVAQTPPVAPITEPTVASPLVVSEADLFAVEPESLARAVAAHAEWFVVEYMSVDGSEQSSTALRSLLPADVPLPEAPTGTQVFVDWVGVHRMTEIGDFRYEVEILVRSLVATTDRGFERQPTRLVIVEVGIDDAGRSVVMGAPVVTDAPAVGSVTLDLSEVPDEIVANLEDMGRVIGGKPTADGGWSVVVMGHSSDGVARPVTTVVR